MLQLKEAAETRREDRGLRRCCRRSLNVKFRVKQTNDSATLTTQVDPDAIRTSVLAYFV